MSTHNFSIVCNNVKFTFDGKVDSNKPAGYFKDQLVWGYLGGSIAKCPGLLQGKLIENEGFIYLIEKEHPDKIHLVATPDTTFYDWRKFKTLNGVYRNRPTWDQVDQVFADHREQTKGYSRGPINKYPGMNDIYGQQKVGTIPLSTNLPDTGQRVVLGYVHDAKNPHQVSRLMVPSQASHIQQMTIAQAILASDGSEWVVNLGHIPILTHTPTGATLQLDVPELINNIAPSENEHTFVIKPVEGGEWEAIK